MMQLSIYQVYKHKEIVRFLKTCPVCNLSDELSIWSSMDNSLRKGKEGVICNRCRLDLSFIFNMDEKNEIIDAYSLDYCKMGNLEFKNNITQLAVYRNNTHIKDLDSNVFDFDKYKKLMTIY